MLLTPQAIDRVVIAALAEDAPWGDATSDAFLPEGATASARLVAREPGILSGGEVFARAMSAANPATVTTLELNDGDLFVPGEVLATVTGPAAGVLLGERVALNLVQRMSGIATVTASYVAAVEGTRARMIASVSEIPDAVSTAR